MNIEVLISTMNQNRSDIENMLVRMNIKGNSIIVNQITNDDIRIAKDFKNNNCKVYSVHEKGLSKSRNMALAKSTSDICLLSDDDMHYFDSYEKIINDAYLEFPDVDIIAFKIKNWKDNSKLKKGKLNYFESFKLSSIQISFKNKIIKSNNIRFDESFGSGSGKYIMGEENIFLSDCLAKKMKIYYYPIEIGELLSSQSTWFKGYDELYFRSKGASFYRMNKKIYILLVLQFAIRKYNLYKKEMNFINALRYMINWKL